MRGKGEEVFIVRTRQTDNFTVLPNLIIEDRRLSWGALGLFTWLYHLPPNYRLVFKNFGQERKGVTGKDATRTALAKLQEFGYVRVERTRNVNGTFDKTIWHVTDTPDTSAPKTDFPKVDDP